MSHPQSQLRHCARCWKPSHGPAKRMWRWRRCFMFLDFDNKVRNCYLNKFGWLFWILLERPLENASTRVVPRMKVLRGIFFGQEISVRKCHLKEDQMEQIGCSPKACILRTRKKYFRPYQQEMYDFTWKCWCHEKKGQGFHPQISPIGFLSGWVTPDFNMILVLRGGTRWRPKKTENASACDASLK